MWGIKLFSSSHRSSLSKQDTLSAQACREKSLFNSNSYLFLTFPQGYLVLLQP